MKTKKHAKKNYYRYKIKSSEGDTRNTWRIIKEIIGKKKCNSTVVSKHITVNNIKYMMLILLRKIYRFLFNLGPNLAPKIPQSDRSYQSYLPKTIATLNEMPLTKDEFEKSFKSLKRNKASGPNQPNLYVTASVSKSIKESLLNN